MRSGAHKRIGKLFLSDGGFHTVARSNDRVVRQTVELTANGACDGAWIAAGQVGPAYAALKERVARNQLLLLGKKQGNAAGRMPRCMQNMGGYRAGAQYVALFRGGVDARIFRRFAAEPGSLHRKIGREKGIVLVHVNGGAGESAELVGTADMVDVRMRYDNHREFQLVTFQNFDNLRNFIARIDDQSLVAEFVPDNGAVAREHPYGKDFMDHWGSLIATSLTHPSSLIFNDCS